MNTQEPLTLDVREELRTGGEPLPRILATVGQLKPDQPLRLLATFEPIPLYAVLGRKGFSHVATRHGEGDWEVLFEPGHAPDSGRTKPAAAAPRETPANGSDWPEPKTSLDNRGLLPPEPLVRILETLEHLGPGEVLEALNERDPVFLYPELEARGAAIRVTKQPDGAVRLLIRRGE